MRNLYQCDICGKMLEGVPPQSMPKGFMKTDGYDMCKECYKEYIKEFRKFIKYFAKKMETVNKPFASKNNEK